ERGRPEVAVVQVQRVPAGDHRLRVGDAGGRAEQPQRQLGLAGRHEGDRQQPPRPLPEAGGGRSVHGSASLGAMEPRDSTPPRPDRARPDTLIRNPATAEPPMRRAVCLLLLAAPIAAAGDKPAVVAKPDAFETLVNPNCSHCADEAKRRAGELKPDDPVLCWTRGYSDGGAIPVRFFLAPYRVISDSYGVFVYDPDAGYARGFAPSYTFRFHGWRNGVMVMKDTKDGTLYSCLSGVAFDGPRTGHRLTPIPTLMSTWGDWLNRYPHAVAYHMFDQYKPVELPKRENADSVKSRPAKTDPRLKADALVLGVRVGDKAKAYPLARDFDLLEDEVGGARVVIFRHAGTGAVAAYRPVASQPRKFKAPQPDKDGVSPPDAGTPLPPGAPEQKPRPLSGFKDSKL